METLAPYANSEEGLEQLPVATWAVDTHLRLTAWDAGGLLPLRVSRGIRHGQRLEDVIRKIRVDPSLVAAHSRALEGAVTSLRLTASGREFTIRLSSLRAEDGTILGVTGLAAEVAKRAREVERLAREAAFGNALSGFLGHVVRRKLEGNSYEQVLLAGLKMTPSAQAATFWLRTQDGRYRVAAALGHGRAALQNMTLTAADLERINDPHDTSLLHVGFQASISVSVTIEGEASGYLCLSSLQPGATFDQRSRKYLRLFADELTTLFQHVDLQRTLREKRAKLERLGSEYRALAEFSAGIETINDTGELIAFGMERLLRAFRFDTAMFTEVRGDALHFTHLRGHTTDVITHTLKAPQPLGAGINGRVAVSGEPLYIDDYLSWPEGYRPYLVTGVHSMLALPVRISGQVRHTLAFATVGRRAALDENAVRIAGTFVKRLENAFERVQHLDEIKATREATFRSLGVALEYRDLETRGHTDRVVALAERFATTIGLDLGQRRALVWGAYLHDLGKIAVPDAILLKPARLTEAEFDIIRKHTLVGEEMLRGIPFLPDDTRAVVRHHHERWDGRGYPDQLAGEAIPLLARMFAIIDVYDALTSDRPYKQAWSHEDAIAEIERQAGAQFDPVLASHFLSEIAV